MTNVFSDCWDKFREKVKVVVDSKYFNQGILVAIVINTLSMGIEYHEQVIFILYSQNKCFTMQLPGKCQPTGIMYTCTDFVRNCQLANSFKSDYLS